MHKIDKFLSKLDKYERSVLIPVITQIVGGTLEGLDVKKLKGVDNRYRVRIGKNRIIFEMKGKIAILLDVTKRDDTTYNF